ncbi:MAG TPA: isocitrate/isopropylmalate family dehydrogenase, partial [Thermoanaerobaculia bacterium]
MTLATTPTADEPAGGPPGRRRIAVLPGDGIGRDVTAEAVKVLAAADEIWRLDLELVELPWSADHYLATGVTLPEGALDDLRDNYSAIFIGAYGDPRVPDMRHAADILLGIRFGLDLYINFRPIKLYDARLCPLKDKGPADVDMVIVRENTEDAYCGAHGFAHKGQPLEVATQTMIYTRAGVERAVRFAFDLARERKRKHLMLIDKANAVRAQDIWTRTFAEVAREYPDIKTEHAYIDAACMWMIKNPEWFDVAVTPNLMGDIITDLG